MTNRQIFRKSCWHFALQAYSSIEFLVLPIFFAREKITFPRRIEYWKSLESINVMYRCVRRWIEQKMYVFNSFNGCLIAMIDWLKSHRIWSVCDHNEWIPIIFSLKIGISTRGNHTENPISSSIVSIHPIIHSNLFSKYVGILCMQIQLV